MILWRRIRAAVAGMATAHYVYALQNVGADRDYSVTL